MTKLPYLGIISDISFMQEVLLGKLLLHEF